MARPYIKLLQKGAVEYSLSHVTALQGHGFKLWAPGKEKDITFEFPGKDKAKCALTTETYSPDCYSHHTALCQLEMTQSVVIN